MRKFALGVVVAVVAAMVVGCGSGGRGTSAQSAPPESQAIAKPCIMSSGGRSVLRLTVPADTVCKTSDGFVDLKSHDRYVEFWLVPGASSVDEAVGRVGDVIKDEFKQLKVTGSTNLAVAGAPARRLAGSGAEADDGDPGSADVVVFKMGGHVFVACNHGENLHPTTQQWMMTLVQAAQAP